MQSFAGWRLFWTSKGFRYPLKSPFESLNCKICKFGNAFQDYVQAVCRTSEGLVKLRKLISARTSTRTSIRTNFFRNIHQGMFSGFLFSDYFLTWYAFFFPKLHHLDMIMTSVYFNILKNGSITIHRWSIINNLRSNEEKSISGCSCETSPVSCNCVSEDFPQPTKIWVLGVTFEWNLYFHRIVHTFSMQCK